ncbi:hypothetical protein EV383_6003 [Pseudonocardia sediminis]|uniref:DUF2637 domain-containing protein n=1 Tax=Pseudonocardia sediminis TaxID=1397368 RepID=A0A4Q7V5N7_PSEST|nr:hypothetical protein [Pseudonocardia sediminis]RZT89048.1 hypothetical protein EV383_6003 [Pseudonocardia sediminis]
MTHHDTSAHGWGRSVAWLPGLAVAVGAAVATAHGLFEVAVAAKVPAGIAWIYPLITDGLALVAYTATARLAGSAARYAWSVVIVSAGLSGLAQASYLASDAVAAGDGFAVSPALRFGVGAWPAVAAAIVAHLLYLLADDHTAASDEPGVASRSGPPVPATIAVPRDGGTSPSRPDPVNTGTGVPPALDGPIIRALAQTESRPQPHPVPPSPAGRAETAQDRARAVAQDHCDRHAALPTVRELQDLAEVGRGTAARALQQLREYPQADPTALHLVDDEPHEGHRP